VVILGRLTTPSGLVRWAVWGATAAVVVLYAALRGGEGYSDERDYLDLAASLAAGNGLMQDGVATAFRPPAWPVVLAGPLVIGVPASFLGAVSALCLVGASLLARDIAVRVAGKTAGWVAAFLMLIYPLNVYTAATLYPQAFATLMTLAPISIALRTERAWWNYPLIGGCCALSVLAVPTMLFTAVTILLWVFWTRREDWRRFLLFAGGAVAVPVVLWVVRNYVVFGEFIPVSTATGLNLLLGNSAGTTATSGVAVDLTSENAVAAGLSEQQASRYYADQAWAWIGAHPVDALRLYLEKVVNYFAPYNAPQTAGAGSATAAVVAWATAVPLAVAAVVRVGLTRWFPVQRPEGLMWALFLGNALFMAVAFTRTRFRQPLDSLLIVEAAVALVVVVWLWRIRGRGTKGSRPEAEWIGRSPGRQHGDSPC
jgi:hypothetical protein